LADYLQRNSTISLAGKLTEILLIGITCPVCIGAIRTDVVTGDHAFLYLQEYNPNVPSSVLLPSKNMAVAVIAVQGIFHRDTILPSLNLPEPCKRLKEATLQEVDFSWLCSEHKDMIIDNFFKFFCGALLHSECKYRNQGAMWRYLNRASASQMQKFFGC